MVQLFISSSTAFCFHVNGSEDFNGVRITPLVRALSDLCFVLCLPCAAGPRQEPDPALGEQGWMEPLNVGSMQPSPSPPRSSRAQPGLSPGSAARLLGLLPRAGALRCGRLGCGSQEAADSGADPAVCARREALPVPRRGLRRSWPACAPG